jgi:hypothetical protein
MLTLILNTMHDELGEEENNVIGSIKNEVTKIQMISQSKSRNVQEQSSSSSSSSSSPPMLEKGMVKEEEKDTATSTKEEEEEKTKKDKKKGRKIQKNISEGTIISSSLKKGGSDVEINENNNNKPLGSKISFLSFLQSPSPYLSLLNGSKHINQLTALDNSSYKMIYSSFSSLSSSSSPLLSSPSTYFSSPFFSPSFSPFPSSLSSFSPFFSSSSSSPSSSSSDSLSYTILSSLPFSHPSLFPSTNTFVAFVESFLTGDYLTLLNYLKEIRKVTTSNNNVKNNDSVSFEQARLHQNLFPYTLPSSSFSAIASYYSSSPYYSVDISHFIPPHAFIYPNKEKMANVSGINKKSDSSHTTLPPLLAPSTYLNFFQTKNIVSGNNSSNNNNNAQINPLSSLTLPPPPFPLPAAIDSFVFTSTLDQKTGIQSPVYQLNLSSFNKNSSPSSLLSHSLSSPLSSPFQLSNKQQTPYSYVSLTPVREKKSIISYTFRHYALAAKKCKKCNMVRFFLFFFFFVYFYFIFVYFYLVEVSFSPDMGFEISLVIPKENQRQALYEKNPAIYEKLLYRDWKKKKMGGGNDEKDKKKDGDRPGSSSSLIKTSSIGDGSLVNETLNKNFSFTSDLFSNVNSSFVSNAQQVSPLSNPAAEGLQSSASSTSLQSHLPLSSSSFSEGSQHPLSSSSFVFSSPKATSPVGLSPHVPAGEGPLGLIPRLWWLF